MLTGGNADRRLGTSGGYVSVDCLRRILQLACFEVILACHDDETYEYKASILEDLGM